MVENIRKINILLDENNNPKEILIFRKENGVPTREAFSSTHMQLLNDFAVANGHSLEDLDKLSESGLVNSVPVTDVDSYNIVLDEFDNEFRNAGTTTDEEFIEPEVTPIVPNPEAKEDGIKGKTVAKIAGASVLGIAAIGGIFVACSKQKNETEEASKVTDFDNATFEELMSTLSETSERRIFFENVYTVTEDLNAKLIDTSVFALKEDGEAKLQFTIDEVMAAKIAFNNYSSEELKEIFGMQEVNAQALQSNYQSFVSKISKFAMNGKAPSTISNLIEDEANRAWFESIENAIIDFNKEVEKEDSKLINEKADKVIRTFAYFYTHSINGVDGISNDASTLNCIKNVALNMIGGYYDANVEKEYKQYLVVSTAPGEFDDKYVTEKLAQVQKGETLKFHKDEADKGVCTISNVYDHFDAMLTSLKTEQKTQSDYEQLLIMKLSEVLLDEGQTELSAKVLSQGVTEEVRKEFETTNKKCKKGLEEYDEVIASLYEEIPSFEQITIAAEKDNYKDVFGNLYVSRGEKETDETYEKRVDEAIVKYEEENQLQKLTVREKLGRLNEKIKSFISTIYNNRIRGAQKINVNSIADSNGITKQEWDEKSKEEKLEYAKEHGEVVSSKKEEVTQKVEKEDLTPSEKVEAEKKEEEEKYVVEVEGEQYKTNEALAAAYAILDVKEYCNSINLSQTILEDARKNETVSYDTYINSSKSAMNSAMSKRGITNEKEKAAYEKAWNAYIKDRVDYALEVKKEEDKIKEEALEEIEELNKQQNSTNEEDNSYNDIYEEETDEKEENKDDVPVVEETPSEDFDNLLDDPQLQGPVEGDDIPIVVAPEEPVIESYDIPVSTQSVSTSLDESESYSEEEYVAAALLGLEEALQEEEKANQKVKTL